MQTNEQDPRNPIPAPLSQNKLIRRMREYCYAEVLIGEVTGLLARLHRQGMLNTNRLLKKMNDEIKDREQFQDHLIEAWGADLFITNGMGVRYDPKGRLKGPDLLVASQVYVEVTRIRDNLGASLQLKSGELVDIPDLTNQIYNKMEEKLSQIVPGSPNLLLVRGSGFATYKQVRSAFESLVEAAPSNKRNLLSGIVFDDGYRAMIGSIIGLRPSKGPRFRRLANGSAIMPLDPAFWARMESFRSPECDALVQGELDPNRDDKLSNR